MIIQKYYEGNSILHDYPKILWSKRFGDDALIGPRRVIPSTELAQKSESQAQKND